jgi:hypothetical protein
MVFKSLKICLEAVEILDKIKKKNGFFNKNFIFA